MSSAYPKLFSPIRLAGRQVPNRLALVATLTNYGNAHCITDRWINFLVERARGGTGLIVSEIIAVDPEALAHGAIVTGYDDRNDDGFRTTARRIEDTGATVLGQLWHPGRQQLWHPTRSPQGVSDQPDALSWTVPHVMSRAEIVRLVDAFVAVAERLKRCGFHGVELHGAHGYLITQFLSPWSNTRDDDYGGNRDNRLRFVREVATGVRERCGPDFVIGLKMPADEGVDGGLDREEALAITTMLASDRVLDYIAYSQGNFSLSLENHVPDMHFRPGHFLDLHRAMRAAAGDVPVMALGRIDSPQLAESALADGTADLIGMSRALVSDAAFASKARSGRGDTIRPCVFNNSCWGEVHMGKPLAEFHNPHLAEDGEADWTPSAASTPRRVVVVGAGVAGLEAAWVCAAAGHSVSVLGAGTEPGGKLRLEARLPGHDAMARVIEHQLALGARHGVEMTLGVTADAETVLAQSPDVVILATGAELRAPDMALEDPRRCYSAHEFARSWGKDATMRRGTAVLYDHDHGAATYAVAQALAECHHQVVILTPRTHIAQNVNYCSALGIFRRLYSLGVEIVPATEPVHFRERTLTVRNVFSGTVRTIDNVASFVYATPRRVNDALARVLEGQVETRLVGDCMAPRNLLIAIHEAHHVALELGSVRS